MLKFICGKLLKLFSMSNNTKIRTMQDDLDKTKGGPTASNEQKKSAPEPIQKKSQQPSAQLNIAKPVQLNASQTVRFGSQQPSAKAANGQQDNKLKELIEKISAQTDKDPNNDHQTKESGDIKPAELAIENEINSENKIKPTTSKTTERGAKNNNTDDIDKLKNLINKISKTNSDIENKTENLKKSEKKYISNNSVGLLNRQRKQDVQENPTIIKTDQTKNVETEEIIAPIASPKTKKSFWKKISGKIENVSDSEKINVLSDKNKFSDIKTNSNSKTEKFNNQSGILRSNKDTKQKEIFKKEDSSKKAYYDKNYMPPDERLIHRKQKFYSSVSKRIKLKEEKNELKDLKAAAKMKKQEKIITKEEEYKKLKQGIIQKYHIKIFSLPWKKIISIAFIALLLTGAASWLIFSYIKPPEPPEPPALAVGSELKEFSDIEKKITMARLDLKRFNSLEVDALTIFNSDNNIKIIKLIVFDNKIDKNILSLQEALDAISIINIEEGINHLPEGFLKTTTNDYNLFLFKTKKNSIRYGLAIKINNEYVMSELMKKWEEEKSKNKKMTTVFKPLFKNDRNFEDILSSVSTTIYNNVEIRYVSLIDKETALDYFIHKNILVFTT